jgi:hypothetical protein
MLSLYNKVKKRALGHQFPQPRLTVDQVKLARSASLRLPDAVEDGRHQPFAEGIVKKQNAGSVGWFELDGIGANRANAETALRGTTKASDIAQSGVVERG